MKKLLLIIGTLVLTTLTASLNNLIEDDKSTCIKELENATDDQLWDVFLESQTNLFFDSEFDWISKGTWWHEAENILEIGCGNGTYLQKLSGEFPDKIFKGIDNISKIVKKANERFANNFLSFQESDAEIYDEKFSNSANIVLFRFTLQHLKNPTIALKNAAHYLKTNGHVVIIDSYDKVAQTSHPISAISDVLQAINEIKSKSIKGNRKITLELLQEIESKQSSLCEYYQVTSSNINLDGELTGDYILCEGEKKRINFFNQALMFITLLHRIYKVPVDLSKAFDELHEYVQDENAWVSPGMHLLVLKKIN